MKNRGRIKDLWVVVGGGKDVVRYLDLFSIELDATPVPEEKIFNLTVDDLSEIYEAQDRKCALSGVPLEFHSLKGTNASLDRKDSNIGYKRELLVGT